MTESLLERTGRLLLEESTSPRLSISNILWQTSQPSMHVHKRTNFCDRIHGVSNGRLELLTYDGRFLITPQDKEFQLALESGLKLAEHRS